MAGIEEEGEFEIATESFEKRPAERGLASSHFSRHRDKALPLLDPVKEVSQRLAVGCGEVKESGVGAQSERLLTQAIKRGIHL